MNIHQLSVRYQIDQDRILLSLNTTEGDEVQVWLTRRITLGLWPLLNRIAIDHFAIPGDAKSDGFVDLAAMDQKTRAMLADMRRQEALQTMDFQTPYKSGSGSKPLGDTPMLLTEINLTPLNGTSLHLRLHEKLEGRESVRMFEMQFPAEIMFSVVQLLGQSLQQAQWQPSAAAVVLENDAEPALLEAKRPVYLN
ncbi:MAG: hypothetical protein CFE44_03735 [Burkholderiales bacterium PBB4]|nr:MAG: hypothetical protein CFE44_03735 [Burkholderiales bacterium PBB4]